MSDDTAGDAPKNDQRSGLEQVAALARGDYPTSVLVYAT